MVNIRTTMNFLAGVYRNFKIFISSTSGLAGIAAIIAGIVVGSTTGIVLIIGGSLWTVNSAFSLFDSITIQNAIRKDVEKLQNNVVIFSQENVKLSGNITELEKSKNAYIEQNNRLIESVKKSEQQLTKLSELKSQYESTVKQYEQIVDDEKKEIVKLGDQNVVYVQENQKLIDTLNSMKSLQQSISNDNVMLKESIDQNIKQIQELEATKDVFVNENGKLQESNKENQTQLATLKIQVDKLKELYNSSRELIQNLTSAGDMFNQFNTSIGQNVTEIKGTAESLDHTQDELDTTVKKMKILVDGLKDKSFKEFDKNNDGVISKDEFDAEINDITK